MKKIISTICILSIIMIALGAKGQGVVFNEDAEVQQMLQRYKDYNFEHATVKAWRIQIISTNDRRTMEKVKGEFAAMYPHIPSSWKHVAPYYQVRVGAYKNKTDMMGFLLELRKTFPTASPVVDDIEKIDFVK